MTSEDAESTRVSGAEQLAPRGEVVAFRVRDELDDSLVGKPIRLAEAPAPLSTRPRSGLVRLLYGVWRLGDKLPWQPNGTVMIELTEPA
jgi:hypothetical protein